MEILKESSSDKPSLHPYVKGGLKIGGGVALASIVYDLIRSEARNRNALEGKKEDEVLRLRLPSQQKQKEQGLTKTSSISQLVASLALAATTTAAIHKAYGNFRKKKLKEERDEAAGDYLNNLNASVDGEQEKRAFDPVEFIANAPTEMALLSFLAGGLGTYGTLANAFPRDDKKAPSRGPKKIVVDGYGTVHADGEGDGPLADDTYGSEEKEKKSSEELIEFEVTDEDWMKTASNLLTVICEKNARSEIPCPLGDMAYEWTMNQGGTLKSAKELGADFWFDSDSNNGWSKLTPGQQEKASRALLSDPNLRDSSMYILRAEFENADPLMAKVAHAIHCQRSDLMPLIVKFASLWDSIAMEKNYKMEVEKKNYDDDGFVSTKNNNEDVIDKFLAGG